MGTRDVPERSEDFCDVCGTGDGYLQKCIVCGADYCLVCHGNVMGCVHAPDVCRPCAGREDVNKACARWAEKLWLLIKKRNAALKRLPEQAPDAEK
jgi:hypothetical protein